MRFRFAVPDVLWAYPLYAALRSDGEHEVIVDTPAQVAVRFAKPDERIDAALLSPIEYARQGGTLRILPGIAVSSRHPAGACRLRIRANARSIHTLATDLRSTSDVLLASLLVREKYPPVTAAGSALAIVPSKSLETVSLSTVDAILDSPVFPSNIPSADFTLDVYEEWRDLLDAPLVLSLWVLQNNTNGADLLRVLVDSARRGIEQLDLLATQAAKGHTAESSLVRAYWESFGYTLTAELIESIDELYRLAYEHGSFGDVPDILFLEPADPSED